MKFSGGVHIIGLLFFKALPNFRYFEIVALRRRKLFPYSGEEKANIYFVGSIRKS
jgi:hypothetical protein